MEKGDKTPNRFHQCDRLFDFWPRAQRVRKRCDRAACHFVLAKTPSSLELFYSRTCGMKTKMRFLHIDSIEFVVSIGGK